MTAYINYLVEANLALLLFLLTYRIVLAKQTHFNLMRFFLLASLLISMSLPFINISATQQPAIPSFSQVIPSNWLPEIVLKGNEVDASGNLIYLIWQIISTIYVGGACVFLFVLSLQFISLCKLVRTTKTYRLNNFTIAESIEDKPTFSFFNFIFIGKCQALSHLEKQHIIHHETVHAKQFHSMDILCVSLLQVIFWFNPFLGLYKRYFVQLHEFEADARAVESSDANKYCSLLAKVALQSADYTFANYFNNSLTLKRITMIRTIKRKISHWRIAAATAIFLTTFFILGFQDQVIAQQEKSTVPISSSNEIFSEVDQMPSFKQGFDDLVVFLGQNMKYPKDARTKKIEGTVFTEFVVEKNGELTNLKVLKGIGNGCDEEALRVIKAMSSWNPGIHNGQAVRTKMVLPLKFKLG